MEGQAGAGWYHAQGDPPETFRYWDGAQWIGEPQYPQQAVVAESAPFQPVSGPDSWAPSPWTAQQGAIMAKGGIGARLLAYIIDLLIAFVPFLIIAAVTPDNSGIGGIGVLVLVGIVFWNVVYRQGTTGQTVGKSALNVTLLGKDDHQPIGVGKALGRGLLGWLLNTFFPIDLIWALFDGQNQRLVDKILNTNVFKAHQDL